MNIVTLSVSSQEDVTQRALAAFEGKEQGAYISFESYELLWQVLNQKRLDLVRMMTGQGGMSIRELARRAGRDVKAVHRDVHTLLKAGVIDRGEDGLIVFPYDAIHVDFMINQAA